MKKGRKLASSKDVDLTSSEDEDDYVAPEKTKTNQKSNKEFAKPTGMCSFVPSK